MPAISKILAQKENEKKVLELKQKAEMEVVNRDISALKRAMELVGESPDTSRVHISDEVGNEPKPSRTLENMKKREANMIAYLKERGETHYTVLATHFGMKPDSMKDWLKQFIKREGERCLWTYGTTKSHFRLKNSI